MTEINIFAELKKLKPMIDEISERYFPRKFEESNLKQLIIAVSALIGVVFSIIFDLIIPVHNVLYLEITYVLYSFISGVILYVIVREVIPKNEKGKPLYFMFGVIAFTILILIIKYVESLF